MQIGVIADTHSKMRPEALATLPDGFQPDLPATGWFTVVSDTTRRYRWIDQVTVVQGQGWGVSCQRFGNQDPRLLRDRDTACARYKLLRGEVQ